jgi:mRNA interferase MazF
LPDSNQIKDYPFEVSIPQGLKVTGAILSDQAKSLDWKARDIEFLTKLPQSVTTEVLKKLKTLL